MSVATRRSRAFTLIELMAAMVMLGILYAISLSVFNTTYAGSQQQTAEEQVQIALGDGLRVASLPGNHFTFPSATVSQMALPAPLSISSGVASGNALSGTVVTGGSPSNNDLLVGAYVNGTCVLGLATSSSTMTWATSSTDQSSCVAGNFASAASTILGTKDNPTAIGLP